MLVVATSLGAVTTTVADFWNQYQMSLLTLAILMMVSIAVFSTIVPPLVKWMQRQRDNVQFKHLQELGSYMSLDDHEFEKFTAEIFRGHGYGAQVSPRGADDGIDIELTKRLKRYAVQVKRYGQKNKVSPKEIRDFHGSYSGVYDGGFFVTTSDYTKSARAWGESRGIKLINGPELAKMRKSIKISRA